jgi:hypothetical protein
MNSSIKITITPLSVILIAAVVIVWIIAGRQASHETIRLLAKATPFLLLVAASIVLFVTRRRLRL